MDLFFLCCCVSCCYLLLLLPLFPILIFRACQPLNTQTGFPCVFVCYLLTLSSLHNIFFPLSQFGVINMFQNLHVIVFVLRICYCLFVFVSFVFCCFLCVCVVCCCLFSEFLFRYLSLLRRLFPIDRNRTRVDFFVLFLFFVLPIIWQH